jgi:hypothetical protein
VEQSCGTQQSVSCSTHFQLFMEPEESLLCPHPVTSYSKPFQIRIVFVQINLILLCHLCPGFPRGHVSRTKCFEVFFSRSCVLYPCPYFDSPIDYCSALYEKHKLCSSLAVFSSLSYSHLISSALVMVIVRSTQSMLFP